MSKQTRITVKGQVTIPKDVRDALGLKPGDLVTFEEANGAVTVRKGRAPEPEGFTARLERARKLYPPLPLEMSTDEYMALVREPVPFPPERK